jgi:RsiW-degrading membrane proteinase PrsW (M82 family)
MNLNRLARLTLIASLVAIDIIALLGFVRQMQLASIIINSDHFDPTYILATTGCVAVILFASMTIKKLLKNEPISKDTYVISGIFGIIAAGIALMFAYGLFQDLFRLHCRGFYGSQSSCILSPLIIWYLFILHPFSLLAAGVLSAYGIYKQFSRRDK